MACVALTSLIGTIEIEFLVQSTPRVKVSLHDRLPILSFVANLSCLQAFLHSKSSGAAADDDALRDLEIEIRDFALRAEDDIEIQLTNILLASDTDEEYPEKLASHELLHLTLQEAAENATELLKIVTCRSEKEADMATVALTILITKFKYYFPTLYLGDDDDELGMESFLTLLDSLHRKSNACTAAAAINITNFALKAVNDIERNFLLAKHTEEEEASQQLHQTLKEAAQIAEEIIKKEERMPCGLLTNCRSNEAADEAYQTQPCLKHYAVGRMVGRHHDCTLIKDQLFSSLNQSPKLISIVGMVGIGKTTLARNVYEDPSVASHFDVRAWVPIPPPQNYNKREMLRQLLHSITPVEDPNVTPHHELEMQMQVRKCLCCRKYLIVLDNITDWQAWTDIRKCVLEGKVGSCILLTTRHFNPNVYKKSYIHNMTLLDPKQSWQLFCNILSIDEEHLAPKFEKIRNHIVEKCDGLPQLIVEVAKRLSKCNNIQQGWIKIEKELESLGLLDHNALNVSYNMLPPHLKVCFLYFGVFPKRKKILVKILIRLWNAEGFVKPLERKELEDQVYDYIQELTDRSLLLIEDRSCNGKIKTCRMHSALHSFCVGEANKGGILCAVNTQQHSGLPLKAFANSCRWLSIYSHRFDYYVLFGMNIPRSIFFFHENLEMFVPPKLLRVLAFDTSISLQRVPVHLGGLVFLRYLSITQWFDDLDDVVSNNPNLETLVISGNGAPTFHLPSSIWKPPHLRHVELGNSYTVDPPSADKKNLQTLAWVVRPIHCRKKMYNKFPNIKNLKIFLKDDIEPCYIRGRCSNPIILDHFDCLEGLEKLSISVFIGCNAVLPKQCMYPSGLKKLKLSGTNISQGDLNVIAMLPQLTVLKLENAFHGTIWKVGAGGFLELRFLLLEAKELKQWVLTFGDSFCLLRRIVLRSCNCLEHIPKSLNGYMLETIELEGCNSSLVASAKQFQQNRKRCNDLKIKILDLEHDESLNKRTEMSM